MAISTATAFIVLAAALSFVDDRAGQGAAWSLRGTIAPGAASSRAAQLPAARKHV